MENEKLEPIGTIGINQKKLEQCEWCFQFDEDEPQIFAWTAEEMTDENPTVTLTIDNTDGAYISFTHKVSGKTFKLFSRQLSEEGLKLREFQIKQADLLKKDLENFDKNMEDYASENKETK
jgi:hypothetical protein